MHEEETFSRCRHGDYAEDWISAIKPPREISHR
jgi:hypothetical protein